MAKNWRQAYSFSHEIGYIDYRVAEEVARLTAVLRQCREIAGAALHITATEAGSPDDIYPLFAWQDRMFDVKTGREYIQAGIFPVPDEDAFYDALVRVSVSYLSTLLYFFKTVPAQLPDALNNDNYTEHQLPPFIRISRTDEGPMEIDCAADIVLPQHIAAEWARL